MPGRQNTDNVLIAYETMNCINQKRKGTEGLIAVKLDVRKVYDRIEWVYLEEVMRKLGFQERWISLSMMCVKSVSFSVLINGEPKGRIISTRDLWQGDPISPYLFLLCAEGLSTMLRREASMGKIKGILVCRGAPHILHLFFVDNCIIFCKTTREEGNRVIKILEDYESNSGQNLNKEKTLLFFSKNTSRET